MKREQLKKLTQDFLRTYGYLAKPIDENAILFSRPTGLGVSDDLLVYFHEIGEESVIKSALSNIVKKHDKILSGTEKRRFFLSSLPLGRAPEGVIENGFKYQVPVWFFDREFSTEKRLTPLKRLEEETSKYEDTRIAQPYKTRVKQKEKDLCEHLINELEYRPEQPCIRIILAPAGYGKTVLMGTLYTKLRDKFLKSKQEQQINMRPLLMLPGHLKQASDVESLINNFIGDEYDYGVVSNKNAFDFWVRNNFVVWLLDGLEELILKIPEEFIYTLLNEYIYTSNGFAPQIIIAIRKSLLATSYELAESIAEWEGVGLKIYELCDWDTEQKKNYFRSNLKLRHEEIENFIKELSSSDTLQKICSVPYYCSLVSELKNTGQMRIFNDECDLVDYTVKKLCEREFDKGIDNDIIPINTQIEIFVELAIEGLKANKITKEMLRELAELYLGDISGDIRENQVDCLLRHALLTQIGEEMDFMHDILKQYLIGVGFSRRISNNMIDVLESREIEIDTLTFKYILKNSYNVDWKELMKRIYVFPSSRYDEAIGFRNIMKIFLLSGIAERGNLIANMLQSRNLTGLIFKDLDLSGFRFQGSKLDSVRFENCNLSGANFSGCYFKNTSFSDGCNLSNLTIRGAMLESISDGQKTRQDKKDIERYFYEKTKIPLETREPCQAVINLKKVLEKIVKKGKGYKIPRGFIIQVKCSGGIPAERCVDVAVKHGIITVIGDYAKIRIDLFEDVKSFVNNPTKELSKIRMEKILDDICTDTKSGCKHIYKE